MREASLEGVRRKLVAIHTGSVLALRDRPDNNITLVQVVDCLAFVHIANKMSFLMPCTCRGAKWVQLRSPIYVKGLATSKLTHASIANGIIEDSPAQQARKAAQDAATRRNVGPFPFVDQPGLGGELRRPWQQLDRGQKVGRSISNSSNAYVRVK